MREGTFGAERERKLKVATLEQMAQLEIAVLRLTTAVQRLTEAVEGECEGRASRGTWGEGRGDGYTGTRVYQSGGTYTGDPI